MHPATKRLPQIDTERLSSGYRQKAIDLARKRLLVTNFADTEQAKDLTEPPNCEGFGRIRHFQRGVGEQWPRNPLPIDPASSALGLPPGTELRTQVFQNAVCNWRCWYCFVDFKLLSANRKHADWLTAHQMIDLYLREPNRPPVIDLTGGQPDLTPEWIPWMIRALRDHGLHESVYLWSDDNLSNDFLWRYLTEADLELISRHRMYGRVCCFKGFDSESFAFNTAANPALFNQQFSLFQRLLGLGIDLYAYVTFTCPDVCGIQDRMRRFVDRLQGIHPFLPLRTIPLEIRPFTPVRARLDERRTLALGYQQIAADAWCRELDVRFDSQLRTLPIDSVPIVEKVGQ